MTTAVTSAPALQGHCNRCGKVWTLQERQGRLPGGAVSQQAVTVPRQSPAISSLAEGDGKGKPTVTATAMTSLKANTLPIIR